MPLSFGKWRPVESCKPCQGASPDGSGPVERGEQCSLVVTHRSCKAKSRDEFRDEVVRFTQRLGFETVSAITVVEHARWASSEFIAVRQHARLTYVQSRMAT
jgi:hypothetical protein